LQRELKQQLDQLSEEWKDKAKKLITLAKRLLEQFKNTKTKTKNKLYALHEQQVFFISNGKARKRCEYVRAARLYAGWLVQKA
jgi:hypothetical protein